MAVRPSIAMWVKDFSKSKCLYVMYEIGRMPYTERWPTWEWVIIFKIYHGFSQNYFIFWVPWQVDFIKIYCLSRVRRKSRARFWGGESLRKPTYPNYGFDSHCPLNDTYFYPFFNYLYKEKERRKERHGRKKDKPYKMTCWPSLCLGRRALFPLCRMGNLPRPCLPARPS